MNATDDGVNALLDLVAGPDPDDRAAHLVMLKLQRRFSRGRTARELAAILRAAESLQARAAALADDHPEGCSCSLCKWSEAVLEVQGGPAPAGLILNDLRGLAWACRQATAGLRASIEGLV